MGIIEKEQRKCLPVNILQGQKNRLVHMTTLIAAFAAEAVICNATG
jgi:hypothetical protein